ncbi:PF14289 domain protein [Bacteroidetes bacterium oral taxon 272 str. F0290]|nr:PF14289 domain protein [Bacteroidetes bacterium oral taxon 272 str. F0290]
MDTMLRLFIPIMSLLALTSCASEYQIKGTSSISRLDGKMLFVKIPEENQMVKIDSAEVVHGLFAMKGAVDSIMLAALYMDDISIIPFVIEKGQINVSIDNARTQINGTPLNDRLAAFIAKKISIDDRAYELEHKENQMIMDGKTPEEIEDELTKERQKLMEELNELAKAFIKSNYDNILGPGIFGMICSGFDIPLMTPLIDEVMKDAPENFKCHPMVKEYIEAARRNMDRIKHNIQSQP